MTRRENLLRTLRHDDHERMPAFFAIDNFHYPPLPAGAHPMADSDPDLFFVELSRYMGLDVLVRAVPPPVRAVPPEGMATATEDAGDRRTATVWETPAGVLRQVSEESCEANTTFLVEHAVKDIRDYEALTFVFEHTEKALDEENLARSRGILDLIGTEGIAYVVAPSTPIMDLARTWVGLERLVHNLVDAPDRVEAVLNLMAGRCYEEYELVAANSPCEVIVLWDDANSLYLSRAMFERYCVPVLRRFAEIAHRHGKVLVNHTCGKINAFLDLYPETKADAIDWLTPPPLGDVDPTRAQEILGEQTAVMLAFPPWIMRDGPAEQVQQQARRLLESVNVEDNFVFMIPAPTGTPRANIRRVVEMLVNDYDVPLNSSERFGNILAV